DRGRARPQRAGAGGDPHEGKQRGEGQGDAAPVGPQLHHRGRHGGGGQEGGGGVEGRAVSVLVGKSSRVLVQGMGKHGTFHAIACRDYGTKIVGGVTPGKGGTTIEGFPIFDSVAQA